MSSLKMLSKLILMLNPLQETEFLSNLRAWKIWMRCLLPKSLIAEHPRNQLICLSKISSREVIEKIIPTISKGSRLLRKLLKKMKKRIIIDKTSKVECKEK